MSTFDGRRRRKLPTILIVAGVGEHTAVERRWHDARMVEGATVPCQISPTVRCSPFEKGRLSIWAAP